MAAGALASSGAAYSDFAQGCKHRGAVRLLANPPKECPPMTPHLILPITLTLSAAAVLTNVWLGMRIGQLRRAHRVSIGDGGVEPLTARMRAQANYIENTPFFLILVGLIELAEGPRLWLWIVGMAFILARIAHGLGMDGGRLKRLRMIGILTSALILIGLAGYGIFLAYAGAAHRPGMIYAGAVRAST
jgi:uncharacterized membrane protein YecN with MAPEG domain